MIILGIDPGFGRCGFAIVRKNGSSANIIKVGVIETFGQETNEKRLWFIIDKIKDLIAEFKPQEVAIEKIFFLKNRKTALNIGEIIGALKYLFVEKNIKIFFYTPLQVKQSLTGYGRATKKQINFMLKQFFKNQEVPLQDDAADALAIVMCHIFSSKFSIRLQNKT
jgi:crossover junction endodeoxyribonuclease RuvC